MIVSDHQPFLFGHAGYWSKVFAADTHIAMLDVALRQEDHLGRGEITAQGQFGVGLTREKTIGEARVTGTDKAAKTIRQLLMSRRNRFGARLEKIANLLEVSEGKPYSKVWLAMAQTIQGLVGAGAYIRLCKTYPPGHTTFRRNLARVQLYAPDAKLYLCGPAVRDYRLADETAHIPALVHVMNNPDRRSFLEIIAREERPADFLRDYRLEHL